MLETSLPWVSNFAALSSAGFWELEAELSELLELLPCLDLDSPDSAPEPVGDDFPTIAGLPVVLVDGEDWDFWALAVPAMDIQHSAHATNLLIVFITIIRLKGG